jgi:serine/threonine protein kinase
MVMEFVSAGALVSPGQLTPDRRMPEPVAQYFFAQMAAGLAYLHEQQVVGAVLGRLQLLWAPLVTCPLFHLAPDCEQELPPG